MTETELDILECFDNNIGNNLDLTKNYIYVLKLVEDRYYVGRTSNIFRRIQQHFTSVGSIYTKKYKPLKVIEVEEEITTEDERFKTMSVMEKYGWERVRGSGWCSLEIPKPNIERNNKPKVKKFKKIVQCENDERIKILYCVDNENVISIGEKLQTSPSVIASRLEKLNIIDRRQLARGYLEYIEGDLYKRNIERREIERNKFKNIENDIIEINESVGYVKVELANIKKLIREKYLNRI